MLRCAGDIISQFLLESDVELGKVSKGIEKLLRKEFGLKINRSKTKDMQSFRNKSRDSLTLKLGVTVNKRWINSTTCVVLSQTMDKVEMH